MPISDPNKKSRESSISTIMTLSPEDVTVSGEIGTHKKITIGPLRAILITPKEKACPHIQILYRIRSDKSVFSQIARYTILFFQWIFSFLACAIIWSQLNFKGGIMGYVLANYFNTQDPSSAFVFSMALYGLCIPLHSFMGFSSHWAFIVSTIFFPLNILWSVLSFYNAGRRVIMIIDHLRERKSSSGMSVAILIFIMLGLHYCAYSYGLESVSKP